MSFENKPKSSRSSKSPAGRIVYALWHDYPVLMGLLILALALTVSSDVFLDPNNLLNVLRQISMVAIVAVGEFFVLSGGGIDIGAGSVVGFTGIVLASSTVRYGLAPLIGFVLAIAAGCLTGSVNGLLVTRFSVPPFIATLGMMSVVRGFTYIHTNAYPIPNLPESLHFLGRGYLLGIPVPVWIMVAVFALAHFVAERTRYGRYNFAIGGSLEAARLSGINVRLYRLASYVIAGGLSALSGVILACRLASGQPNAGIGMEFDAVTAAVLGGTSLYGGKGNLVGVFFGAVFMGVLANGMTLLNVSSYWQQIAKGVVLIGAIMLDAGREKNA